jgi:regulator of sirC expression with transglutaminase-like and TPR domain
MRARAGYQASKMGKHILEIATIGLIDDEEILLDIAALALSQQDHVQADLDRYIELLDEVEEQVCADGGSAVRSGERAAVLARVLHGDLGFSGDSVGYDAPVNADFIRVMDRRKGLPISLAILYVAMARRLGWSAYVLNVPGHVLVQIGESDPVVIDPFRRGIPVSRQDLSEICKTYLGEAGEAAARLVAPMTNRAVLSRLLLNQAARAEQEGDLHRAFTVYQRMTKVAPDDLEAWRHLARLHHGFGDLAGARHCLLAMLEITNDRNSRDQIIAAFKSLGAADPTAEPS